MLENQQRKFKRSAKLIGVLSKYGFRDVLSRLNIKTTVPEGSDIPLTFYERVRMALEELGPTFVKLGQTFSDRDDLLPHDLVTQLQRLQDNVEVLDLDIKAILLEEFGELAEQGFDYIDDKPMAAASIAQVYRGRLTDGTEVVVKIKRPDVDATIQDDLLILKDLISIIDTYSEFAEQLNLKYAILAFEQSLLEELSLLNEKKNLIKFRENFEDNEETYVPKVYENLCSNRVLTMEFVEGIKITNVEELRANGVDLVKISEIGYRLFMSQILDFGLFHADPHAGNILVNKKQQLVFIDFGAVGKIPDIDQPLFDSLILNFMSKQADNIVRILKKLAIHYQIKDERKFRRDVYEIFDYVHNSSLKEIDIISVMNKMKDVLKDNRLVMPDYFYLLFKGVSLMDGVGRKINPDLDVINSLKPFTKKLMMRRLDPEKLAKKSMAKLTDLFYQIDEIPAELRSVLSKLDENRLSISADIKNVDRLEHIVKSSIIDLILGLVLSANMIATALFWTNGAKAIAIGCAVFSFLLVPVLLLRVLRR